jgi:hypothetical protein
VTRRGGREWRERLIGAALRDGRITLASAPTWRRRLDEGGSAERDLLTLGAAPTVGEANVRAMEQGEG